MKRLSFSVRTRLLALCFGLMAVLGGANLLLAHMIGKNESQHLAQREQYRRSEVISEVERAILRERHIGSHLNSARLTNDKALEADLLKELEGARRDQQTQVQAMEEFNPEAAATIRRHLSVIPQVRVESIEAIRGGEHARIRSVLTTLQTHLDAVQETLEEASLRERLLAEESSSRELRRIREARRAAVTMVLFTGVLGTFLTVAVVRSILTPLQAATRALRQLNSGRTEIDLPPITKDEFGDVALALRQFRDQADALRKRAYEDTLTGLGNRVLLEELLPEAISAAQSDNKALAVLCLDLDNFRAINDRLGHKAGDRYLCEAVNRLQRFVPTDATVFRYAGDNFVVVLSDLDRGGALELRLRDIAATVLRGLSEPYLLADQLLNMSVSIGVASYPADGDTAEQLISGADAAMHVAKKNGRNNLRFAGSAATSSFRRQLGIAGEIRRGLDRGEFVTFYQPIVDISQGKVMAAEALLRWRHPQRGLLLPADFIQAAEQAGLISSLGELCLVSAHTQSLLWQASGRPIRIAVNLSAHQVHEGKVLELLKRLDLQRFEHEPLIDFELTESALLYVAERGESSLHEIKALGYRLGLDDFGIAYSSLSYLQTLPIDKIKIDRQFTAVLDSSKAATAIASAIITLGRTLDLDVVAEGVETEQQARELARLGCSLQQGFLFSHALPGPDFEYWAFEYEGARKRGSFLPTATGTSLL